jgi:hypothetical protein
MVVGVTSPRNVIEVRAMQESNALSWMMVTLLGIVTEVRAEQPETEDCARVVTLLGMLNPPTFPLGYRIKVVIALL